LGMRAKFASSVIVIVRPLRRIDWMQ